MVKSAADIARAEGRANSIGSAVERVLWCLRSSSWARNALRALALSGRRPDVGVGEFVAFEQQRFTCGLCKRIGKAIAEVQLRSMAAAFAEIAIGVPCDSSLEFGHGLNDDLRLFESARRTAGSPRGHGSRL